MKHAEKIAIAILFSILIMSCGISNHNNSNLETEVKEPEPNQSWFFVFNIHKNNSTNIVDLVSKNKIAGKIKTESTNRNPNYLTLYLYSDKQLIDTVAMDHPLYKHYEYMNQNGTFTFKDTVIDTADFAIRTQNNINEIKIFETLKNQPKKQLTQKSF